MEKKIVLFKSNYEVKISLFFSELISYSNEKETTKCKFGEKRKNSKKERIELIPNVVAIANLNFDRMNVSFFRISFNYFYYYFRLKNCRQRKLFVSISLHSHRQSNQIK